MSDKYKEFAEYNKLADEFTDEEQVFIMMMEKHLPFAFGVAGWPLDESAEARESFAKCMQYLAVKAFKLNSAIGEGEME